MNSVSSICSRYKVSKWSSCQEPQQIRWGVCGGVIKDDSQIMMVRMVTFLEVRWVARNGGLSTSLIENGSSLRTKPALSLYLKQTKTVRLTSNLELLFDQVICSRTYTCQMFKTDILPFHEKKKKKAYFEFDSSNTSRFGTMPCLQRYTVVNRAFGKTPGNYR